MIALLPWGLLWGPGCQPGGEDSGAVEVGEVAFSVAPEAVDFGAVPLGESAWQTIVITNEGGADLTLAAAELSQEAGFFLNTGGNAELAPGEQQSVFVAWTPEASGSLEATLSLRLEGSERLVSEVALTGSGAEALPGLSVSSVDFGVVGVGCEVTAEVRVSNDGALPAEVVALRLDDSVQDDSTLDDVALEAPALPVTLEPGGGLDLTLRFAPGDVGVAEGALEVDVGETLSLPLRGEGAAGEAWEEDFVVSGDQPVSLLIAINGEITVGRFGERLEDALPDLYDTLAEAGVPWRVAWLVLEEGSVVGETAYIDDGFSTDAAVAATLGMLVRLWASGFVMKNEVLATSGPYGLVRHPLYVGNLLICAGFCVASGLWWSYPLALAMLLFYYPQTIQYEDHHLRNIFQESWDEWAAETKALLPRLTPYSKSQDGASWSLKRSMMRNGEPLHIVVLGGCLLWIYFSKLA